MDIMFMRAIRIKEFRPGCIFYGRIICPKKCGHRSNIVFGALTRQCRVDILLTYYSMYSNNQCNMYTFTPHRHNYCAQIDRVHESRFIVKYRHLCAHFHALQCMCVRFWSTRVRRLASNDVLLFFTVFRILQFAFTWFEFRLVIVECFL